MSSQSDEECYTILLKDGEHREEIICKKSMLATASSFFASKINCADDEGFNNSYIIEDVRARDAILLAKFMATGRLELKDTETALGLLQAALKYEFDSLARVCCDYIGDNLAVPSVTINLLVIRETEMSNDKNVVNMCSKYIIKNIKQVVTEGSLSLVSQATLVKVLQSKYLEVTSELDLFRACVKWAYDNKKAEDSLRDTLGPILNLIRFQILTPKEFATFVVPADVLTHEETSKIFCSLLLPSVPMPKHFCRIRRTRNFQWSSSRIIDLVLTDYERPLRVSERPFQTLTFSVDAPILLYSVVMTLKRYDDVQGHVKTHVVAKQKSNEAKSTPGWMSMVHEQVVWNFRFPDDFVIQPREPVELYVPYESPVPELVLFTRKIRHTTQIKAGVTFTFTYADQRTNVTSIFFGVELE